MTASKGFKDKAFVVPIHKYHTAFFVAIGVWKPDGFETVAWKRALHNFQRYHVLFLWVLACLFSMVLELVRCFGDLEAMINVFFILATDTAMFAKFRSFQVQAEVHKKLTQLLRQPILTPRGKFEEKTMEEAVKKARVWAVTYGSLSLIAVMSMWWQPVLDGSYRLPVAAYVPLDLTNFKVYCLVYLYQCLGIFLICLMNIFGDSWVMSFQIYAAFLLDVLKHRLTNVADSNDPSINSSQKILSRNEYGTYVLCGSNVDKEVELNLRKCVAFHREIIHLVRTLESVMSVPFAVQMIASCIVLCVNLYLMSFMSPLENAANFFTLVFYQVCMSMQIFMVCYFGDHISYKSSELNFALYSANWYAWTRKNKRTVLIMMEKFKVPIKMTALSFFTFDLRTFSAVLNSAYSYFALLRNINN